LHWGAVYRLRRRRESRFRRCNTGNDEQIGGNEKTELDHCIGETSSPPADHRDQKGGNGQHAVLAKPPNKVSVVIAARASLP